MDTEKPDELLKEGLLELGLAPLSEHISTFLFYLSELKKWNRAYNLTGLKKDEDIIIKHFLDSLLYLKAMPEGEIRVADIGSGAGFPGIPIKIIRQEIEMYLIEPSGKKSSFLGHIIRHLSMGKIEVVEKRIEDIKVSRELPVAVNVAVTRALFSIKDFIKKASHIVKQGGTLVLNKGPKVKDEIKNLEGIRYQISAVSLPLTHIRRFIISVNLKNQAK
ncbi:MAG: 16S rRNA (guanine(527)-N(7))-methyltransferase RsmG [Nitrospirae bacterium]|nr:16S rRNA (guanine(527)-N(7))-methyltransferase RsmG [Nitrospirota bacterium]